MTVSNDYDECVCGHVADEHGSTSECQVDGCLCGYFVAADGWEAAVHSSAEGLGVEVDGG